MSIYVKNDKEKEMLYDFMVHVKHDLESVMELYSCDCYTMSCLKDGIWEIDQVINDIEIDDTYHIDIKDIVDNLMLRGMTDKEISEITGLSELTVKRCRMRQK